MRNHLLTLAAVCLAASTNGCKDTTPPASSGGTTGGLSITASDSVVVANGTNTVTISVTNTTGSSATLTTDRGTFPGSATTATVAGTTGTVVLTTCNAATTGCTGTAHVNAVAGSVTDSLTVTFGALATLCAADCTIDPGCVGLACTATTGGTCSATTISACTAAGGGGGGGGGTTTGKVVTVTPARTRLPPNGTATTSVVVKVTTDDAVTSGAAVTLSTTAGTLSATTGTTGADGTVTVTLTAPATVGTATITATATAAPTATGTATVTFPKLGVLALVAKPVNPAVLGTKGSGWNESGYFQIQALDDKGGSYPDGLAVRFEHHQLGGSTFGGTLTADTATCLAASKCIGFQAVTESGADTPDKDGLVTAWILSGNMAGTLAVTATATVAGVTQSVSMPTMAVVGGKASGSSFSVVCGPRNVPALAETDCSISLVEAPYTCMALLKDRFGNLLGRPTQVIFESEASAVGQIATTPEYDPAAGPTTQDDLGSAVQIFGTLGAPLPFDLPVQAGEPSVSHGLDGCGTRTHNPRDGVVTIAAIADGEEAFFDANGNGVYDTGEPFVDQGEPFVDADDDGVWDDGIAVGSNGKEAFFDVDGNGAYTAGNTTWDANTKIWTQTVVVYTGTPVTLDGPTAGRYLGARWSATASPSCSETLPDPGFAVTAKVTGPPEIPAGSQDHYVYASDLNLNMLHGGSTYAVSVISGPITAQYWGLDQYSDELGFFYRYWPCDSAGANCASQCRVTASLPCVMKPSLSAFSCGPRAAVTITGGDKPGTGVVEWSIDTPYSVYGTGKVALDREWLSGSVTLPPP